MPSNELPLQVLWEKILGDILDRTMKFPKYARFTFASRIDGLSLDIMDGIVVARYKSGTAKTTKLKDIDSLLNRLRVMLRIAHDRRYLSTGGLEHVSRNIEEAGRMLGGWQKQLSSVL